MHARFVARVIAVAALGSSAAQAQGLSVTITDPSNGESVNTFTPVFQGETTAASTTSVRVTIPDGEAPRVVCETTPIDLGGPTKLWICAPPSGRFTTKGSYTVTATVTEGEDTATASILLVIDKTPPTLAILEPSASALVSVSNPLLRGTAEDSSGITSVRITVTDSDSNNVVNNVSVPVTDGQWQLQLNGLVDFETYSVRVSGLDRAGNARVLTGHTFHVDTTRPTVVIEQPEDGDFVSDLSPTFSGTTSAPAGRSFAVTIPDGEGVVTLCEGEVTTGGSDSSWSCTAENGLLEDGGLYVATVSGFTNDDAPVSESVSFRLDVSPPSVAVQAPPSGSTVTEPTTVVSGTVTDASPLRDVVVLVRDGQGQPVFDEAVFLEDDAWSLPLEDLVDGETYTVEVTAHDVAGNAATLENHTFVVNTSVEGVSITSPAATRDSTPRIEGTGEPGAEVVLEVDGTTYGPVVVSTAGEWFVDVEDALVDGNFTLVATMSLAALTFSDSQVVRVDTRVDLTVDTPRENSTISGSVPVFEGSAELDAVVTLTVDGRAVGTTRSDGRWRIQGAELEPGTHSATVRGMDVLGNETVVRLSFEVQATRSDEPEATTGRMSGGAGCMASASGREGASSVALLLLVALAARRRQSRRRRASTSV